MRNGDLFVYFFSIQQQTNELFKYVLRMKLAAEYF